MAFIILIGIGGFLLILGTLILIVDALHTRRAWGIGIAVLMFLAAAAGLIEKVPAHLAICGAILLLTLLISLVFMGMNWAVGKRGGILQLLAIPLLAGAFLLQPPPDNNAMAGKSGINDPFAAAMSSTRKAIAKIHESRSEVAPEKTASAPTPISAPSTATTPVVMAMASPTPPQTLQQRLSANRQAFKQLAVQFEALASKRSHLPKNDLASIHAFNAEAATYASNLDAAREEQEKLIGEQKSR